MKKSIKALVSLLTVIGISISFCSAPIQATKIGDKFLMVQNGRPYIPVSVGASPSLKYKFDICCSDFSSVRSINARMTSGWLSSIVNQLVIDTNGVATFNGVVLGELKAEEWYNIGYEFNYSGEGLTLTANIDDKTATASLGDKSLKPTELFLDEAGNSGLTYYDNIKVTYGDVDLFFDFEDGALPSASDINPSGSLIYEIKNQNSSGENDSNERITRAIKVQNGRPYVPVDLGDAKHLEFYFDLYCEDFSSPRSYNNRMSNGWLSSVINQLFIDTVGNVSFGAGKIGTMAPKTWHRMGYEFDIETAGVKVSAKFDDSIGYAFYDDVHNVPIELILDEAGNVGLTYYDNISVKYGDTEIFLDFENNKLPDGGTELNAGGCQIFQIYYFAGSDDGTPISLVTLEEIDGVDFLVMYLRDESVFDSISETDIENNTALLCGTREIPIEDVKVDKSNYRILVRPSYKIAKSVEYSFVYSPKPDSSVTGLSTSPFSKKIVIPANDFDITNVLYNGNVISAKATNKTEHDKTVVAVANNISNDILSASYKFNGDKVVGSFGADFDIYDSNIDDFEVFFLNDLFNRIPIKNAIYRYDTVETPVNKKICDAQNSFINATYEPNSYTVHVNGCSKNAQNQAISILVVSKKTITDDLGNLNSTLFRGDVTSSALSVTFCDEKGGFSKTLKAPDNIEDGDFYVIANTEGEELYKEIFLFDVSSLADLVGRVNIAIDATSVQDSLIDIYKVLGFDNNQKQSQTAFIANKVYANKPSNGYDVDNFLAEFNKAYDVYRIKDGVALDSVLQGGSNLLDCTYGEYSTLTEAERKELGILVKGIDFYDEKVNHSFSVLSVISRVRAASTESWNALKSAIEDSADVIGLDIKRITNGLNSKNKSYIYQVLKSDCATVTSFDDIIKLYEKIAKQLLDEQNKASKPSGGGGGGGSASGSSSIGSKVVGDSVTNHNDSNVDVNDSSVSLVFTDVKGHFAETAIYNLTKTGILLGYDDKSFRPNSSITRAEFAKIVFTLFGFSGNAEDSFDDVNDEDWFAKYVNVLANKGIIKGDGRNFSPYNNITRQDAILILSRAVSLKEYDSVALDYFDAELISDYAIDAVKRMSAIGIVKGDENNCFNPNSSITRGETAVICDRIQAAEVNK